MKLREQFKNAEYISEDVINEFDYIYFVSTRRKHSSGYMIFEIYGEIFNKETKERKFYNLSKCSDVIDLNRIELQYEWFMSIDIPESGVFRLFTRKPYKFVVNYMHCSSFCINIIGD